MIVLPFGICTPKLVSVKLQPMPRIRSASSRKCRTVCGMARPPEPSASGCGLGEGALALEAGADRDRQQLGQLAAARPRPPPNARPGRHRSPAALRFTSIAAASRTASGSGPLRERARGRVVERRRSPRSRRRPGSRPAPARRGRSAAGRRRGGTPLGMSPAEVSGSADLVIPCMLQGGVVVGLHPGLPARIAHRHHQHRHQFAVGLGDAAIGVLGARARAACRRCRSCGRW